ncbi:MAG: glycosyltransferase family 2 protein [Candidatus Brocadiales bacterium]
MVKFSTALRRYPRRRIEKIDDVDLVVGIPCYNNDGTIGHVVKTVGQGLSTYFPKERSLIIVCDGGSTDDSREEAIAIPVEPYIEKLITIYRGVPGKGSALRAIFEVSEYLDARVCAVCDSDLRSITPEWIKNLIGPIEQEEYQVVTPYYRRFKFDGTITNNVVYCLTRALYGRRVRQPIGGDFAFSRKFIKTCMQEDVWDTDVGRFGIDIWLTTTAIVKDFRMCQARLGVKVHDAKDPGEVLGAMFRQVVSTLFNLMEEHYDYWKDVKNSRDVETIGEEPKAEPQSFPVNKEALVENFKTGFNNFGPLWKTILTKKDFAEVQKLTSLGADNFFMDEDLWVRVLYDFAATFHHWKKDRYKLVMFMTPIYFARVAHFVNFTEKMSDEEAEKVIQGTARRFELEKGYLLKRWESKE